MGRNPASGEAIKIAAKTSGEVPGCQGRQGLHRSEQGEKEVISWFGPEALRRAAAVTGSASGGRTPGTECCALGGMGSMTVPRSIPSGRLSGFPIRISTHHQPLTTCMFVTTCSLTICRWVCVFTGELAERVCVSPENGAGGVCVFTGGNSLIHSGFVENSRVVCAFSPKKLRQKSPQDSQERFIGYWRSPTEIRTVRRGPATKIGPSDLFPE